MNRLQHKKIAIIADWLTCGFSVREVARVSGVHRDTIASYKKAIMNDDKIIQLSFNTRPSVTQRLEDVAEQRGLSLQQIAEQLIENIARDDLFEAVLGE